MLIDGNMLISGSDDCTILQWNLYLLFMRYEEEQKLRERMQKGIVPDTEEESKEAKLGRVFLPAGTVGEHKEGVQDLLLLNNGLIVSCGQEKEILVWKNQEGAYVIVGQFPKTDELRCMDYVLESNQLLIGTGSGTVLTQSIVEFLSYQDTDN
jgi:hypothetical protein